MYMRRRLANEYKLACLISFSEIQQRNPVIGTAEMRQAYCQNAQRRDNQSVSWEGGERDKFRRVRRMPGDFVLQLSQFRHHPLVGLRLYAVK